MSGRHPRSITSAPAARIDAARATTASTLSADASTISAKIRMSWCDRSAARPGLPKNPGKSFNSSGPRTNGTPKSAVRRVRSARQRPGTMTRLASSGRGRRRTMIASVISAATLTPMSSTDHSNPRAPLSTRIFSSRGRARCPVKKRVRSVMQVAFAPRQGGFELFKQLNHVGFVE